MESNSLSPQSELIDAENKLVVARRRERWEKWITRVKGEKNKNLTNNFP